MEHRSKLVRVSLVSVAIASGALVWMMTAPDVACTALGLSLPVSDAAYLRHGDKKIADNSWMQHPPCHYDLSQYDGIGGADGVLFNDCRVSWVDGSRRTSADDLGIPCPSSPPGG